MKGSVLVVAIVAGAVMAAEGNTNDVNVFASQTAGFRVSKPAAWTFASMQQVSQYRASARLKDKELEEAVRQRANAPLVAIMKHVEPYDDLNPSVQVILRPLGTLAGKSAVELMKLAILPLQQAMADFQFVEPIQKTTVGGKPAAFMKAKYTVANPEGREFKTFSRMWIVPRGQFMFMMSMSGPQEGGDVSEKEFAEIHKSIQIAD